MPHNPFHKKNRNGVKRGTSMRLSPAQRKLAGQAPPFNQITKADFDALKKKGKKKK
jgi:hypothetical protein